MEEINIYDRTNRGGILESVWIISIVELLKYSAEYSSAENLIHL